MDVFSSLTGAQISTVPLSDAAALYAAVEAAQAAFPAWSATPSRSGCKFYHYKTLLERDVKTLVELVREENGKTYDEARAEVEKAAELTEFACFLPQLIQGEFLEVSRGVEARAERWPLGVVANISPFNFPTMVPHWIIPNAIVLGNTMILKPSEQVPLSAVKIAELLKEAGLPDGVLNVVHGDRTTVEAICDHPDIKAVSFVGSTKIAKTVYIRATSHLKRCVALGGAKNHLLVLPDAHPEMTASNVAASMSGCAAQRCMAGSTVVGVGAIDGIVAKIVEEARKIVAGQNLGSVISKAAKERIERHITEAEAAGAKVLLDGRHALVPGYEDGCYVGATVIDFVTPDMRIAQEEVFGPVLAIMRTNTLDEALAIENANPYGNAAAVFTSSGASARYAMDHANVGMIGVNIGVPVPHELFFFGGWNDSKFGACGITGKSSIEFWTQLKKTTTKWNPEVRVNWMS